MAVSVHRALLSVDMEGSGRRSGDAAVRAREVLFTALREAFGASGVPWEACVQEFTGDGVVVIVPPEVPKHRLVHPLLGDLADGLRHHNRAAAPELRIRVRAALHAGELLVDHYGATGRPQVLLARLLASRPLREALANAPGTATVALAVSDRFFEDVVAQGHRGVDADLFTAVVVREKETDARAWLTVIGHPGEHSGADSRNPAEESRQSPASGGVNISGSQVEVHGDLFGGDKRN